MVLNLEEYGNIPVNHAVLSERLRDYRSPNDKIAAMEKHGDIIRLKKGLYVVSPKISRKSLSRELIANHLYGPSYVSFETALAFYGIIPEKVFAVRSATFKRAKRFENAVGRFEYITVPPDCYSVGISQQTVDNEYTYLLASPEKALCDTILATPNLRLQSVKAMQTYLEEDLRVDFSVLKSVDTEIIRRCKEVGRKKEELKILLELLSTHIDVKIKL
jgi:predicted transcriptional regulator of viral defense system